MNEKQPPNVSSSSGFSNPFLSSGNAATFSRSINPFLPSTGKTAPQFQQQQQKNVFNPFFGGGGKPFSKPGDNETGVSLPIKSNAVLVKNIPKKFYESGFLNEFFSQFGTVVKTELKMDENYSAVVIFVDHSYAEAATKTELVFEEGTEPIVVTLFENKLSLHATESSAPAIIPQKITRPRDSLVKFKSTLASLANSLRLVSCPDAKTKYDVLDKIDKAIRKGLKRDRETYKAMQGTCLDMCPEKERYMRVYRNQISPYELLKQEDEQSNLASDEMNHDKAVKEYSRSSADQEEPLPHELRPASVLKMTMNYLVRNFMHEELSDRPDWFDFLWNRLRAIRKDITQQNLKCSTSIELLEICARFHILCSHHLCEQEMRVFDSKINLENLTKCLQTLKHMYEDAKMENIKCENEPEFRCYQILLNLNNGDTLREVMAFSADVRNSSSVKFAVEVFSAVHENNYIRFFKLLKRANFLSACLMHPYFQQIRSMALQLMSRCFSVPKNDTLYPLEHLQDVLAFNDVVSTQEFCQHYGFNFDESSVYFNRTAFMQPDENFLCYKSSIVMGKCADTFAEVVNNGVLPPAHNFEPTASFDVDGYYNGNYHELNDVLYKEDIIDTNEAEENESTDLLKISGYCTDVTTKDVFATTENQFCSPIKLPAGGSFIDQHFSSKPNPFIVDNKLPPSSSKTESILFPTLTKSDCVFSSKDDQEFKSVEISDNPFLQKPTASCLLFKSKSGNQFLTESKTTLQLVDVNPFSNNTVTVAKTDLRAKLLAKRNKEKEDKQDPEFELAQEDYEDAIKDDEEDGNPVLPTEDHIMFLREDIQYFADQMIEEEISETNHNILSEVFTEIKKEQMRTEGLCQKVIALFCIQEARTVACEVMDAEQTKASREKVEQYEIELKCFADEFVNDSTEKILREYCSSVRREEIKKLEQSVLENVCEKTQQETIHHVLTKEVRLVAEETLAAFSEERRKHLQRLFNISSGNKLQKLFTRWVKAYKYHMFIKTTLQDFPPQAPMIPPEQIIKSLDPDLVRVFNSNTITKFESTVKLRAIWNDHNKKKDELRNELQRQIQLEHYFHEIMLRKENNFKSSSKIEHRHYRLVVRSPTKVEHKSWLLSAPTFIRKIQNTYSVESSSGLIHQSAVRMKDGSFSHLSVAANYCKTSSDVDRRSSSLYGMTGLLFIIEAPNIIPMDFWNEESLTLQNMVVSCNQPKDLKVVVLTLAHQHLNSNEIEQHLSLNLLQKSGFLGSYICDTMQTSQLNAFEVENQIQSLLCWLFDKCLPQSAVSSKPLSTFVEDGMAKLFFQTFHENCLHCQKMDLPTPNPVDILQLYNNSIEALSQAVLRTEATNPDQGECTLWNDETSLTAMSKLIGDLLLPDLPYFDSVVWQSCYEACKEYVTIVTENRTPVLANRINSLLRKFYGTERFPWAEVLELCIFNKLSVMYSDQKGRKTYFQEVLHYRKENVALHNIGNPLKTHMKDLTETKYVLERSLSYGNMLKRRKYSREHSLRDSIEDANSKLVEIEECLRRRKRSSPRSSQSPQRHVEQPTVTSLRQLIDETNLLYVGVNEEKENMMTSISRLNETTGSEKRFNISNTFLAMPPEAPPSTHPTGSSSTLEGSVLQCLESIEQTRSQSKRSLEYWRSVLGR